MGAIYYTLHLLVHFVIVPIATGDSIEGSLARVHWNGYPKDALNYTVVKFDPYVSILDKENHYRYTFGDLVSLVAKVASRFNKIFVQQSESDLVKDLPTSLMMSPMAAAEYNRLTVVNGTKLEVWLSYASSIPDYSYEEDSFVYHREPTRVIERMISLATQANTNAPGTVSTILLPYKLLLNDKKHFSSSNYAFLSNISHAVNQWGIIIGSETFSTHPGFRKHIVLLKPDIVIFALPPVPRHVHLFDHFSAFLEHLESFAGKEVKHGFILSIPDTDTNGYVNMSRLVTTCQQAMEWAEQNGTTLIMHKAFDKPSADSIEAKTNGWWRLVENHLYKNASEFIFGEKVSLKSSEEYGTPIIQELTSHRNHVQIIFGLGGNKQTKMLQHTLPEETDVLLEKIGQKFSNVVLLVSEHSREAYRNLRSELNRIGRVPPESLEATLIFMPSIHLIKLLKGSASDFAEIRTDYSQVLKPVTTYVVPFMGNQTTDIGNYLKYTVLASIGVSEDNFTFGYVFDASLCSAYSGLPHNETVVMDQFIKSAEAQILIFYFEEDEQTVKLGVNRMFSQRIVVLEECRKVVSMARNLDSVKLVFMMRHYSTSSGFYQNKRDMLNFVDYWQKLSDWSVETNSTIILNNAVDGYRYSREKGQFEPEIGWWRYNGSEDHGIGRKHMPGDEANLWIDKIEEFRIRFPDTYKSAESPEGSGMLPTDLIVLMSLLCVLVIIGIIVALLLLMRKKHPEEYLLKSEIQEFFKGADTKTQDGEHAVALRIPYNKDRYEINSNTFSIQEDRQLGSGEFGKVMRGSIVQNGECIHAAVKTVNSLKAHKSALSGLLSEIKVLSYVGKHENITELLGANTGDLQNGKVFIFLELCELGSLEKYLRGMRPQSQDYYSDLNNMQRKKSDLDERVDKYLDMVSRKGSLDDSFSGDMYRWSQQICRGMEYLASKHVVHADLATRNVLLDAKKEAKICDFGLSRRMYNYTNYVKQQQEPLPWKWMSPEALRNLEFGEKSDVWAYGVTLWEIYSLAEQPYPGLSWHIGFADTLEEGLQLLEPKYDDRNVYWIMKECWRISPQCRPTFADLMKMFN